MYTLRMYTTNKKELGKYCSKSSTEIKRLKFSIKIFKAKVQLKLKSKVSTVKQEVIYKIQTNVHSQEKMCASPLHRLSSQ